MDTAQLPGSKQFDTQMEVHIESKNTDMILAQEFQKHLSNESRKDGIIDCGNHKKVQLIVFFLNRDFHVQHN